MNELIKITKSMPMPNVNIDLSKLKDFVNNLPSGYGGLSVVCVLVGFGIWQYYDCKKCEIAAKYEYEYHATPQGTILAKPAVQPIVQAS